MNEGTPIIIKKKKGHGGHGHHGGSWKVAYADFVTAMMAFFMVMWIMGLSDETRTQVSGYFNDPTGFMKTLQRSNAVISLAGLPQPIRTESGGRLKGAEERKARDMREFAKIKSTIAHTIKDLLNKQAKGLNKDIALAGISKNVQITMTSKGLKIEFMETAGSVFFELGSKELRPEARPIIKSVGYVLAKSGRLMNIEGHTDAHPYGSRDYNNADLSSDRARSVMHVFELCGVKELQIRDVEGLAATDPKNPSDPYDPVNRRVSVLLPYQDGMGKVSGPKDELVAEKKERPNFVEGFSIQPPPLTPKQKAAADALIAHAEKRDAAKNEAAP